MILGKTAMSESGKPLSGKTLFITGASRGIGLAIALRAARDGANIAVAAKTAEPHKHLPGTIYSAAEEIEAAGGKALPLLVDVRDEASVLEAVERTAAAFGGIDICVNNASAIQLTGTEATDMKRYDLMHQVNARGTFLVSKACIPHLKRAANPHVLALSPPLDLAPHWFGRHVAYSMAKYGMSLCMLGMADEYSGAGIAFNALWPRTGIATAAIQFALAGDDGMRMCRTPQIMADAAHAIFCKPARDFTGQFLIDDSFLYAEGVRDFEPYRVDPTRPLMPDFFVPEDMPPPPGVKIG
jgi:citronellol/citronellal dehydrogenase